MLIKYANPIKEKQGSSFSEFGDLTENLLFTCHHRVCWHPGKMSERETKNDVGKEILQPTSFGVARSIDL